MFGWFSTKRKKEKEYTLSNLVSVDFFGTPEQVANKFSGLKVAYGATKVRIARYSGNKANIDILMKKGAALPTGVTFNSARRYKFNDNTFQSKGLKVANKTCVTIG